MSVYRPKYKVRVRRHRGLACPVPLSAEECDPTLAGEVAAIPGGVGMPDDFQEITQFTPAYDERDPDPKKNFGFHGVSLRMVLKGPKGAVQFVVFTGWQLPHVQEELDRKTLLRIALDRADGQMQLDSFYHPMPADLGFHSPKPMYEGQLPMGAEKFDFEHKEILKGVTGEVELPSRVATGTFDPCEWLDGKPCYYDGSTVHAEGIFKVLVEEGSAGVWRELREYYDHTFRDKASGT